MTTKTFEDVGIMSIGEMGLGIAQVLMAHGYRTYTYAVDRRYVFSLGILK